MASTSQQSTHCDMGWGWPSYGSYPKVMVRSSQGHSKAKSSENVENSLFSFFLLQLTKPLAAHSCMYATFLYHSKIRVKSQLIDF